VVGLVLGALHLPMTHAISLVEAGLDLLLNGERQLERHRRHGLDQQLADGHIDLGAEDALAERVAEQLAAARAHVGGEERPVATRRVLDVHPGAAQAADDTPLEQGRSFARWRLAPFPA
jgi:hypothetical protein